MPGYAVIPEASGRNPVFFRSTEVPEGWDTQYWMEGVKARNKQERVSKDIKGT